METRTPEPERSEPDLDSIVQTAAADMQGGELERALQRVQQVLERNPDHLGALNVAGLTYERLERFKAARQSFERALEADPDEPDTLNNYGAFLCNRKRLDEAEAHFMKAAENSEYNTPEVAYTNAGLCARRGGNLARAAQHFRAALKANPETPVARYQMARLEFERENYRNAQRHLEAYENSAPHTAQTAWLGVRIARERDDPLAQAFYADKLREDFAGTPEHEQLTKMETHAEFTNVRPDTDTPATKADIKDEDWLLEQDPEHYTLQVLAGRDEKVLVDFIHGHELQDDMAYFRFTDGGETWYSLVFGSYSTFAEAEEAIDDLPSGLRDHQPWARRISTVHEAITAAP